MRPRKPSAPDWFNRLLWACGIVAVSWLLVLMGTSCVKAKEVGVLTFGSLFAGIGGFDLGFERAGMECKWQVEIDPYCQKVLAKHWPNVRRHDDVRTFPPAEGDWGVDVICGGFPCQDISLAGRGAGIAGARSGLWSEYARIIGMVRPRIAVVENSPAITLRGINRVLGDLAELGYDAEWQPVPAAAFGADHIRWRAFLLAYPYGQRSPAWWHRPLGWIERKAGLGFEVAGPLWVGRCQDQIRDDWASEPRVGRVAYGVPCRLDRTRALGNAVVPQVAEWIGRRIVEAAHV